MAALVVRQCGITKLFIHIYELNVGVVWGSSTLMHVLRLQAVQVLAEIKERRHVVQDLEQSLLELLQIFPGHGCTRRFPE